MTLVCFFGRTDANSEEEYNLLSVCLLLSVSPRSSHPCRFHMEISLYYLSHRLRFSHTSTVTVEPAQFILVFLRVCPTRL